jgi:hypothetical protein
MTMATADKHQEIYDRLGPFLMDLRNTTALDRLNIHEIVDVIARAEVLGATFPAKPKPKAS